MQGEGMPREQIRRNPWRGWRLSGQADSVPERFRQADPEDNIRGAPELVIEVLSPSNTAAEILDKEQLCLANGTLEFWVVDPDRRHVRVSTSRGSARVYRPGDDIPLALFGNAKLAVNAIFE
jgi:Uma2 family endonuclease